MTQRERKRERDMKEQKEDEERIESSALGLFLFLHQFSEQLEPDHALLLQKNKDTIRSQLVTTNTLYV